MFLFSVTAQELKQALKGSGKIKLCFSGALSQRKVVCLPPEPALHAFCEIAMPLFSLRAFVPACEMPFGPWKPSNVLSITCSACINHNVQVPEPPKGRTRESLGNWLLHSPSRSCCISPKITLLSGSQSSWEYKTGEKVVCESSVISFGYSLFMTRGKKIINKVWGGGSD